MKTLGRAALLGVVAFIAGCSHRLPAPNLHGAEPPRAQSVGDLEGRTFHLCCNMYFSGTSTFRSGSIFTGRYTVLQTTDANYQFVGGIMLPAGAKVRITSASLSSGVTFKLEEVEYEDEFNLTFLYGKGHGSALDYYLLIFRDDDPRTSLPSKPGDITRAIASGRIIRGMTREDVVMARGYPPFHHTPDLQADSWLYYISRGLVERVTFDNGRVESVLQGPAP